MWRSTVCGATVPVLSRSHLGHRKQQLIVNRNLAERVNWVNEADVECLRTSSCQIKRSHRMMTTNYSYKIKYNTKKS